jgi:hypothetical protein
MTPTQLPNESARAFAAFKRYVEMGHKRSLVKLGRKLGISRQAVEQLSKRYHWQKRLRELELEDCKRAVKADEQAKLDAAKQLEAERLEFRRRAIAASRRATERALQILEQPLGRSRPSDAARLLVAGDAIGRAALELTASGGGSFGLNPTAQPIIRVVLHRDAQSEQLKKNEDEFLRQHPEFRRPRNGLENVNETGLAAD